MSINNWYVTAGIGHKGGADNRIEVYFGNKPSSAIAGPFKTREEAQSAKNHIVTEFATKGKVPVIAPRKAVINTKNRPKWTNPRDFKTKF